jgi:hypothetical protein
VEGEQGGRARLSPLRCGQARAEMGARYASGGIEEAGVGSAKYVPGGSFAAQPALRGVVTLRGPGAFLVVRFHGCGWVRGGGGVRCEGASSGGAVGSAALVCCSRDTRSASSSLARQQCLYFFPEPQWHGSLRPGCFAAESAIARPSRFLPYQGIRAQESE